MIDTGNIITSRRNHTVRVVDRHGIYVWTNVNYKKANRTALWTRPYGERELRIYSHQLNNIIASRIYRGHSVEVDDK